MAAALFMFAATAQAQLYVGGSLGLGTQSGKVKVAGKESDKASTFSFAFKPEVGFFVGDNLAIGARPMFAMVKENDHVSPTETIITTSTFGIEPFVDYYLAEFGDFRFLLEATVPFGYSKVKTKFGSTTTDGDPEISLGVNITPVIGYGLDDHWTLRAALNFMNVGFGMTKIKHDSDNFTSDVNFSFGANMDNVFTTGLLTVGAVFAF